MTRVGNALVGWENTIHREGRVIRIGEGYSTPIRETHTGVVDGATADFVLSTSPDHG